MICISCNTKIDNSFKKYPAGKGIFSKYFPNLYLFECPNCGIVSVDHAEIDQNTLDKYYSESFRTEQGIGDEEAPEVDKSYRDAYLKARTDGQRSAVLPHIDKSRVASILEYGAGYGFSLRAMGEQYPQATLYSYDVDNRAGRFDENIKKDDGNSTYEYCDPVPCLGASYLS